MMNIRRCALPGLLFWNVILYTGILPSLGDPARLDPPQFDRATGARFRITPPLDKALRIDFTKDLRDWYPLDVLPVATPPRIVVDSGATNSSPRFYRSVEVDPVPGIFSYDPDPVAAGATLKIRGQFFSPTPGANRVTIAGLDAKVIGADPTTLTVVVPLAARSGVIRVTTTGGEVAGAADVTVLNALRVQVAPPAGLNISGFAVSGAATGASLVNNVAMLPVPKGPPSLVYASAHDTNRFGFLAAIALENSTNLTLDAQSTAEALVFLNPLGAHNDSDVAAKLVSVIKADLKVRAFADALSRAWGRAGDPLDDPEVLGAYTNAVASVLLTPILVRTVADRVAREFMQRQSSGGEYPVYYHEPVATRWLEVGTKKSSLEAKGFPFNPVDWVVRFQELDVDKAFPNGLFDLQDILNQPDPTPTPYPLRNGFDDTKTVSADLAASRINFVSYLSKEFYKWAVGKGPDDAVPFIRGNTIYMMRGIGPAFPNTPDRDFVLTYYSSEYGRAIAINLVAALIDAVSALIDFKQLDGLARSKDLKDWDKFYLKLVDEAAKNGAGIRSAEDFVKAVAKLSQFFFKELVGNVIKLSITPGENDKIWVDGLKDLGPKIGKLSDGISGLLDNKYLKVGSSIGQVAERASGLLRTTPLETTFVVVGEPFKLDVSVSPAAASLGEDLTLTVKSSSALKAFSTNNTRDQINFEGPSYFDGRVIRVEGPTSGEQKIIARIPTDLPSSADGNYTIYVNTQGRRGSVPFRLALKTIISSIAPLDGFAATTNFSGSAFVGTEVALAGYNLGISDNVFFTGSTDPIPVTLKASFNQGLRVYVPAGARTGPIRVDHRNLNGQIVSATGAVFQVLGPPVITSMTPQSGPPGTFVSLKVLNTRNDFQTTRVELPGSPFANASFGGSNLLLTAIPPGATSGPVRVITPAGAAEQFFTVTPGVALTNLPTGSQIPVGGNSIIALDRAVALANGDAFPEDDADYEIVNNRRVELDPPREEGDFITPDNIGNKDVPRFMIGLNYVDQINLASASSASFVMRGTGDSIYGYDSTPVGGDATLAGNQETLTGLYQGKVTLSGHFNRLNGTYTGPILITGNSNRLAGRFTALVTVEGDYNILGGEFNGGIIVKGRFNNIGGQTGNIRSNLTTAVTVLGDNNTIAANFQFNATDCVLLDGAKNCTVDFNSCVTNGGHGLILKGGASYNQVTMRSGARDSVTRLNLRNSANKGHGVLLSGSASFNRITGQFWGNGVDGVMFDGPDVHHNSVDGGSILQGRNGVTVANGAHHNSIGSANPNAPQFTGYSVDGNGENGLAILGGLQTSGGVYCSSNGANGLLISGVNETEPDGTYFFVLTAPFTGGLGNHLAGVRLEGEVHGVHLLNPGYRLKLDGVGLELDGEQVSGNTLELAITQSSGPGAVIRKASRNLLRLSISTCQGAGLIMEGARENDVRLSDLLDTKGPGLWLKSEASANHFKASAFSIFAMTNQTGVLIEEASHDNILENFGISKCGDYGAIIRGKGTDRNQFVSSTFVGANKYGVLIDAGASDNSIGRESDNPLNPRVMNARDNGLAGIMVTGDETRRNRIVKCLFIPTAAALQPAGLIVEKGGADTTVSDCTFFRNVVGIQTYLTTRLAVRNSQFQSNTLAGILLSNTTAAVIGGPLLSDANQIFKSPTGIEISGSESTDNRVAGNQIHDNNDGVLIGALALRNLIGADNRLEANTNGIHLRAGMRNTIANNVILNNQNAGILADGSSAYNIIEANQITGNAVGVQVSGLTTDQNTITRNSITANTGLAAGIRLVDAANAGIQPPQLLEVQANAIVGTTEAPDDSRVEIFQDSGDEGEISLGSGSVVAGRFRVPVTIDINAAGFLFNVTGTVTDPEGNTSEFAVLTRQDFPPSRLVLSSTRAGNPEVFASAAGGGPGSLGSPDNLTRNSAKDDSPSVATGCDRVLFVSDRDGNQEIYSVALKPNSTATRLTFNNSADYDPSWLEPCRKIVFVSERDGNAEIYSMNADGSSPTRLTSNAARDRSPRVSPDGRKILFVSDRGGVTGLWTMNVDGSNPQPFLPSGLAGSNPAWSPDGGAIAFVSSKDGNPEIYTVLTDGTSLTRLTNDTGSDLEPAWVPGGKQILFSSNRSGNYEIYAVSRNGGEPARLTVTTSDNHFPEAQPR